MTQNIEALDNIINNAMTAIELEDAVRALSVRKQFEVFLMTLTEEQRSAIRAEEKELLSHLNWVSIILLSSAEVNEIIKTQLVPVLIDDDHNPKDKLKACLFDIPSLELRDVERQKYRQGLLNSGERITGASDIQSAKTVGDWCKDYVAKVGIEPANRLAIEQYFSANDSFKKLSVEEKALVRSLLSIFEWLKFSSASIQGFEASIFYSDEDGMGVMENGVFKKYDKRDFSLFNSVRRATQANKNQNKAENKQTPATVPSPLSAELENLKQLVKQYPEGSLERRAVEEEIKKLEAGS